MNLKLLRLRIIQEFNSVKKGNLNAFGLVYTGCLAAFFFLSGILGILNYFMIKLLLLLALAFLLAYCIMIMNKNKNHPE